MIMITRRRKGVCAVCPIIDVGNPRAVLSSHSSLEQHHHHYLGSDHDDDHADDQDHDDGDLGSLVISFLLRAAPSSLS